MSYPVIAEQVLDTVQGGWWSRRRRRDDVPPLPAGAVYVFRVGGNYRSFPEGMVFDPSHPDVLDASSVSLVDTRARLVEVERQLPSVSEADTFTVRASFTCQVGDPTVVARQGVIDVEEPLRAYLLGDSDLPRVSAGHRVEEINAVRSEVARRMTAYSAVVPPRVPGMTVEFVSAEVSASESLRAWEETLRDERRTGQLSKYKLDLETEAVLKLAELVEQGPHHASILGMERQEIGVAEVAERIRHAAAEETARRHQAEVEDRAHARAQESAATQLKREMVLTVLRQMGGSGEFVDYHQVLEQLLNDADGTRPSIASGPAAHRSEARQLGDGREGFVQTEEDLVD